MKNGRRVLPLMKGEIKEGVGTFSNVSNHPLNPLLHKEGELDDYHFSKQSRRDLRDFVVKFY
jgi:hypothetical protein